jgi:hypothetical protein
MCIAKQASGRMAEYLIAIFLWRLVVYGKVAALALLTLSTDDCERYDNALASFKRPFTPDPTSMTSPIISWPMMSPGSMAGMKLWKRCRSEPQIAQLVTFGIASHGCSIEESETVSQRTSSLPCHTRAFIGEAPFSHSRSAHASITGEIGIEAELCAVGIVPARDRFRGNAAG